MNPIAELLTLSKRIGKKIPFWVQGAGGNTSVKMDEGGVSFLQVKSSGLRLEDVLDETHFSKLPMNDVLAKLARIAGGDEDANEQAYADALKSSAINASGDRRPSMETGFHVFLPKKYVLHFHALPALLMAHEAGRDSAKIKNWLTKNWEGGFEFIEACMPGWTLTNRLKNSGPVSLLLLKNHGLILQSDDVAILDRWQALETQFCRQWNYQLAPSSGSSSAPMRIYFPDTAVFIERLRAVLSPSVARRKKASPFINCGRTPRSSTKTRRKFGKQPRCFTTHVRRWSNCPKKFHRAWRVCRRKNSGVRFFKKHEGAFQNASRHSDVWSGCSLSTSGISRAEAVDSCERRSNDRAVVGVMSGALAGAFHFGGEPSLDGIAARAEKIAAVGEACLYRAAQKRAELRFEKRVERHSFDGTGARQLLRLWIGVGSRAIRALRTRLGVRRVFGFVPRFSRPLSQSGDVRVQPHEK